MSRILALLVFGLLSTLPTTWADEPPSLTIEGYTDQLSYRPDDSVELHVSTIARTYNLEITRLGDKNEVVLTKTGLIGTSRPVPENASSHGCQWPVSFQFTIPRSWRSGYYNVRLRVTDNGGNFVGRNRRTAEVDALLHRPTRPARQGHVDPAPAFHQYLQRLQQLGWRQPLCAITAVPISRGTASRSIGRWKDSFASGSCPSSLGPSARVTRSTTAPTAISRFHPELLKSYKLVLSVGHDEYWSAPMRDNLEAFIGARRQRRLLQWQHLLLASPQRGRRPRPDMLEAVVQPGPGLPTERPPARSRPSGATTSCNRPENQLTGVGFLHGGYHLSHGQFMDGKGAFNAHRPDHWVFEGTGLKPGEEFGAKHTVVGYECDGCEFDCKTVSPFPPTATARPRASSSWPHAQRAGTPTTPSGTTASPATRQVVQTKGPRCWACIHAAEQC